MYIHIYIYIPMYIYIYMEHVPHRGSMIDGAMWTRGMGRHGQLDLGDSNDWLVPRRVGVEEAFRGSPVLMAACGDWHTLAVTKASTLWSWSLGRDGKLSHNDANNRLVPTQVEAQRFATPRSSPPPLGKPILQQSPNMARFIPGAKEHVKSGILRRE